MAHQPGASEDRPLCGVFLSSDVGMPCSATPFEAASAAPQHSLEPGQEKISLSVQWVLSGLWYILFLLVVFGSGLPYSSSNGGANFHTQNSIGISGLCPPRWPWTFSWKSTNYHELELAGILWRVGLITLKTSFSRWLACITWWRRALQWFLPEQSLFKVSFGST